MTSHSQTIVTSTLTRFSDILYILVLIVSLSYSCFVLNKFLIWNRVIAIPVIIASLQPRLGPLLPDNVRNPANPAVRRHGCVKKEGIPHPAKLSQYLCLPSLS
jgi:hypothetical protein